MSDTEKQPEQGRDNRTEIQSALPISRVLRFILGLVLIAETVRIFRIEDAAWNMKMLGAALAFVPFYAVIHYTVGAFFPRLDRWLGALLAVAPVALLFFAGPSWARVGVLLFVGVSLLLTAILGDPGCEVMVIPGLFFRERTHLACIAFTPLDWIEAKATKR